MSTARLKMKAALRAKGFKAWLREDATAEKTPVQGDLQAPKPRGGGGKGVVRFRAEPGGHDDEEAHDQVAVKTSTRKRPRIRVHHPDSDTRTARQKPGGNIFGSFTF